MAEVARPDKVADLRARRYWITRDSDAATGALDAELDVWLELPERVRCYQGAFWITPAYPAGHWGRLTREQAVKWLGPSVGLPDTDMECVRVG